LKKSRIRPRIDDRTPPKNPLPPGQNTRRTARRGLRALPLRRPPGRHDAVTKYLLTSAGFDLFSAKILS
jgi:hypothetical protein